MNQTILYSVALVVFLSIVWSLMYQSRKNKEIERETETKLKLLADSHRDGAVFLCNWIDINEDGEGNFQAQGLVTSQINQGQKILDIDGVEHSVLYIYPLNEDWSFDENYKDPVSEVSVGRKVNLILSPGKWAWRSYRNGGGLANLEFREFKQRVKTELVVIFKVQ